MKSWFDTDKVIAPLDTFEVLPDWLAAGMIGERVQDSLQRQVPEFREERPRLLSVTPQRLRAKGEEWLARYRLSVVDPGAEEPRDVIVVGNLYAPTAELPTGTGLDDGADPDAAFGEPGWTCWLDDLRLQLGVETVDPALPALQDIVDPVAARDLLQQVVVDAGYRDATVTTCRPNVVRYKPGSRCTVVVDVQYDHTNGNGSGPDPIVIKTHQGDKGQTAWAAMTALWESPLARQGVVTLAEPLAYEPERRILFQGPIPEECTLKELIRLAVADGSEGQLDRVREELAKTGYALAALHQSATSYGETATIDGELDELREVVGRLSFSVPPLDAAAEPLLTRLEQLSVEYPADPIVPSHHDFRPAQVLLHYGDVGFIDFEGASMAEPALDLGRFRAKLRDIVISVLSASGQPLEGPALEENLSLMDELCDHFLNAYSEKANVTEERVLLWETCDLLTAMLHAWTKVRLARIHPRMTVLKHHLMKHSLATSDAMGMAV
jgi:hypothetical protein